MKLSVSRVPAMLVAVVVGVMVLLVTTQLAVGDQNPSRMQR